MARSANQKLKLLYLCQILTQQTDEEHPMTVQELISQLAAMTFRQSAKAFMMTWTPCPALRGRPMPEGEAPRVVCRRSGF